MPSQRQWGVTSARSSLRAQISRISFKPGSLIRLPELIALLASLLLVLAALFSYFYALKPERNQLDALTRERARLKGLLSESTQGVKHNQDTQASVDEISRSLELFETKRLAAEDNARTALIENLNQMIRHSNLRSPKFAFSQLGASSDEPGQNEGRSTPLAARKSDRPSQDVFPGIGISLTVEGAYGDIRRFISQIENSKKFIVIDSMELESSKEGENSRTPVDVLENPPQSAAAAQRPAAGALQKNAIQIVPRSLPISLKIDMAAYFRRAGVNPASNVPEARSPTGTASSGNINQPYG